MTTAEVLAVSTNQLFDPNYASALTKLNQILDNVLWWFLCDCPGGFASTAPAFPVAPAGSPQGTALPPAANTSGCVTTVMPNVTVNGFGEPQFGALDLTQQFVPNLGPMTVLVDVGGRNCNAWPLPVPNPTSFRMTMDVPPASHLVGTLFYGSAGAYQSAANWSIAGNGFIGPHWDTGVQVLPAGATHFCLTGGSQAAPPTTWTATMCVQFYGPGGSQFSSCCPPDPQVLGILNEILSTVTAVQRYKAPFAYIAGATHTAFTGSSSTAISQLLGIRVTVTASPASATLLFGNPNYVMNLGWISVVDANGILQEKRLTQLNTEWFPEQCQLATSFNLALNPGVTVTWEELQAEP